MAATAGAPDRAGCGSSGRPTIHCRVASDLMIHDDTPGQPLSTSEHRRRRSIGEGRQDIVPVEPSRHRSAVR